MLYILLGLLFILYIFIVRIVRKDRGSKESLGPLLTAFGFGILAVLVAGELNYILTPQSVALGIENKSFAGISLYTLAGSSLAVAVIEESLKSLPLAFFLYKKNYFNEITDGVIYFGLAGLAFGMIETLGYTLKFGQEAGLYRLVLIPYFHASVCAIFGIFLARKKYFSKSWLYPFAGLIIAIIAHALYNFGLMSGIALLILGSFGLTLFINIALFKNFKKAQREEEAHLSSLIKPS